MMRDLGLLRGVCVVSCFLMLPAVLHAEGGARRGGEDAESSSLFMQQPLEPPVRGLRIGGWRRYTTFAGFGGVGEHPVRAVTAGVGFGVRKIESFMEERVEVVERRVSRWWSGA